MAQPKISQAEFDAKITAASEIDWVRLAAFIDGEGSILIAKNKRSKKGMDHPTYVLTLIVANTSLLLMDWLYKTFSGGSYFSHSLSQRKWSTRICYSWRQFDNRAVVILKHCLPYFIIKREQAETGLAFRRLTWDRGRRVSSEDLVLREQYRNKMCSLNAPKRDAYEDMETVQ